MARAAKLIMSNCVLNGVVALNRKLIRLTVTILTLGLAASAWAGEVSGDPRDLLGPLYDATSQFPGAPSHRPRPSLDSVRHWNEIAIDASGIDHSLVREQFGPTRASRAMAIVHVAVFEAVNAIAGGYRSYAGLSPAPANSSMDAAIALAAHDTLAALFPSQTPSFDAVLAEELGKIPEGRAKRNGIDLGRRAAAAILTLRANDGSQHAEPRVGVEYIPSHEPGKWQQDPISQIPIALGAYWGRVQPFALKSSDQFRAPVPPPLDSSEYTAAFDEVKRLGGDGVVTPTERTLDQTIAGIFWAYDGTPSLCAPPRLYNQIAMQIADQMGSTGAEVARLLALVNVAMADAGIALWESKYYYEFWRPITGIRKANRDGNHVTVRDPTWAPLGAPFSNGGGPPFPPNFTPPFPAYPSGHAGFGGALFQTLRNFYRTDDIAFTFVSDEFNGVTQDNQGTVRPLIPRSFSSLSQAEEENGQSRIYLGIHWAFDKTQAIAQGRRVADYVFENAFVRERGR